MDATYLERYKYEYAISINKIVQKYKIIDNEERCTYKFISAIQ